MTSEAILYAIGDISDGLVEDAVLTASTVRRPCWRRWTAAAACLAAVAVGILAAGRLTENPPDRGPNVRYEEGAGVTIARMELQLSKSTGEAADMLGFFIYGGRSYVQYETVDGQYADSVIGTRLGTATGLIDEWTPRDGYVELAGSVSGDFYTVQGFDAGFLLCMRRSDGDIGLFINDNGLTLRTGADLYEERLHLSENYAGLTYETHDSWNQSLDQLQTLPSGYDQTVRDFIAALDAGEFQFRDAIPEPEAPHQSIYDALERWHVYFQTPSGVPVHIRLLDGGYVIFTGLYQVCVQVDQAAYDAFTALLDSAGIPAEALAPTDFEKCLSDPVFGPYMPQIPPDQYASILYNIDPETGAILDTREIELGFSADGGTYCLRFFRTEDVPGDDPMLVPGDLTPEAVKEAETVYPAGTIGPGMASRIRFGVQLNGIAVLFHGYDVTPETAIQVMRALIGGQQ